MHESRQRGAAVGCLGNSRVPASLLALGVGVLLMVRIAAQRVRDLCHARDA